MIVCEELRGGVEVLCGLTRDAQFGPLLVVGVGGGWAEPLAATAAAALGRCRSPRRRRSCAAARRSPRSSTRRFTAAATVLVALGRLAHDHPRVREIDVNPVRIADGAAVALDGLIVLDEA